MLTSVDRAIPMILTVPQNFPEGPVTVYRFMQSSDCEIDGTWDCTGRYYQPSSSIGFRPPWSMNVPDAIMMRAVASASNGLRTPTKQNRVGQSLDCMNEIIREMSNAQVTSRILPPRHEG